MNLDGIMVRIAKVTLSNTRDVLGNVGHECQGIIVWRFVCRCACLQNDFLVCGLAQTLLGPWSKDRPREYARPGIAKHNKTEETHTNQNIACQTCTHCGNANMEKYGSGARQRQRRYAIDKHWLCLLMHVRRFSIQHNCMEVKYIHGRILLLSPAPV